MNIELHILQNFAPSCLNRDDTNTPKDCEFGGHRRARISSQCIKRSIRRYFKDEKLLPEEHLGERTARIVREIADRLEQNGRDRNQAIGAAERAVKAVMPKTAADSRGEVKTPYLLFLGRDQIGRMAQVVADHWDTLIAVADNTSGEGNPPPPSGGRGGRRRQAAAGETQPLPEDVRKQMLAALDGSKAADVALFGRMLADQADLNVHAACQVAHALSTNRVSQEMDFYTAVDDLKARGAEEDAGAGMLGTVEYNSACFYRYSNIHFGQLVENLQGDVELARRTVRAFLTAAVNAIPTGKQNTFAAHNPPSLVFAVVRERGLQSLANAFERPVYPDRRDDGLGLVAKSVAALDDYWGRLAKAYGADRVIAGAAFKLDDRPPFTALKPFEVSGFNGLVERLMAAVEGGAT